LPLSATVVERARCIYPVNIGLSLHRSGHHLELLPPPVGARLPHKATIEAVPHGALNQSGFIHK
jgi:hypothetical protein